MAEREKICLMITYDSKEEQFQSFTRVEIPYDIDEIDLKGKLRDLGRIPLSTYASTKVYLINEEDFSDKEICAGTCRTLKELGIKNDSLIRIVLDNSKSDRTRSNSRIWPSYWGGENCLYGNPMAQDVKDAINEAERYSAETDSVFITGTIEIF